MDTNSTAGLSIHSPKQAAAILGISERTLHRLASDGRGPKRIRLSERRVGYRADDLRAWVEARTGRDAT